MKYAGILFCIALHPHPRHRLAFAGWLASHLESFCLPSAGITNTTHVCAQTHTYPRTTAKPNQNENLVLKNCSQGLEKDLEKEPELGNGVCSVVALARKGFTSTVDCFEVKQPDLPLKQLLEVAFSGAGEVRWLKTSE